MIRYHGKPRRFRQDLQGLDGVYLFETAVPLAAFHIRAGRWRTRPARLRSLRDPFPENL